VGNCNFFDQPLLQLTPGLTSDDDHFTSLCFSIVLSVGRSGEEGSRGLQRKHRYLKEEWI
jgi:hypothetical protein